MLPSSSSPRCRAGAPRSWNSSLSGGCVASACLLGLSVGACPATLTLTCAQAWHLDPGSCLGSGDGVPIGLWDHRATGPRSCPSLGWSPALTSRLDFPPLPAPQGQDSASQLEAPLSGLGWWRQGQVLEPSCSIGANEATWTACLVPGRPLWMSTVTQAPPLPTSSSPSPRTVSWLPSHPPTPLCPTAHRAPQVGPDQAGAADHTMGGPGRMALEAEPGSEGWSLPRGCFWQNPALTE